MSCKDSFGTFEKEAWILIWYREGILVVFPEKSYNSLVDSDELHARVIVLVTAETNALKQFMVSQSTLIALKEQVLSKRKVHYNS